MKHFTHPHFWKHYKALPADVQRLADKNFALLKRNPQHPSLHFKRVGRFGLHVWGYTIASWP